MKTITLESNGRKQSMAYRTEQAARDGAAHQIRHWRRNRYPVRSFGRAMFWHCYAPQGQTLMVLDNRLADFSLIS